MSYKIGEADYQVRRRAASKFIKGGNRVKLAIQRAPRVRTPRAAASGEKDRRFFQVPRPRAAAHQPRRRAHREVHQSPRGGRRQHRQDENRPRGPGPHDDPLLEILRRRRAAAARRVLGPPPAAPAVAPAPSSAAQRKRIADEPRRSAPSLPRGGALGGRRRRTRRLSCCRRPVELPRAGRWRRQRVVPSCSKTSGDILRSTA